MKKLIMTILACGMLASSGAHAMFGYNEDFSPDVERMMTTLEKYGDSDKMYIDEDEMKSQDDAFYVHLGNNSWISTSSVSKDASGLFTYRACITKSINQKAYEKKWKCPYCFKMWPEGQPCGNAACPSKYR